MATQAIDHKQRVETAVNIFRDILNTPHMREVDIHFHASIAPEMGHTKAVLTMYKELIEDLRVIAKGETDEIFSEAADAIENMSKAYQMMAEAYESEVTKPRWIPVTDRLPEPYTWVLVFAEDNKVAFDAFYDGDQWKDAVLKGLIVTHWMPLPEPPKDGEA